MDTYAHIPLYVYMYKHTYRGNLWHMYKYAHIRPCMYTLKTLLYIPLKPPHTEVCLCMRYVSVYVQVCAYTSVYVYVCEYIHM